MTEQEKRDLLLDYCRGRECMYCVLNSLHIVDLGKDCRDLFKKGPIEGLTRHVNAVLATVGPEDDDTPDNVNHPQHYELPNGIECFDVLLATQGKEAAQAFCICNAIKYLFRHKRKNGAEDVKKAKWYIDKYIELEG